MRVRRFRPPRPGSASLPAIALVTHNSIVDLRDYLDGQVQAAERLGARIVAVDNESTDGSLELLRAYAARSEALTVIEMRRNAGYAAAVNAAFEATEGEYLLLVNPDIELTSIIPVLDLLDFARRHPRVGVVAPRLYSEDGTVQASARRFPTAAAVLGVDPRLARLGPIARGRRRYEEPSGAAEATEVDWAVGAAMLIRRQAFEEVGGWNERYRLYLEDTEFCRRLGGAGWTVAYLPAARLLHRWARASSKPGANVRRSGMRRRHLLSFARFFASHPLLAVGLGRGPGRTIGV
jgi:GT2 family glycosyltransferase